MNKRLVNFLFGTCLILSVFITYKAIDYAADFAYSGKQPVTWVNVVAFLAAIGLVLLGIFIKTKR